MDPVVSVRDLRKCYGSLVAAEGISFEVGAGEILGLVGPNGAGKTTVVECILGLRQRDGGTIRVLGEDPATGGRTLKTRVGAQLQAAALQDRLKVHEAVELFASLYPNPDNPARLLEQWGLSERRNAAFGDLSGGQKQRLFVILALVNRPELVVLDELTTGLDPQARRATWDLVRAVRARGASVLLVTHFMDEAEALCDRVGVIDRGRLLALDAPARLTDGKGSVRVRFTSSDGFSAGLLDGVPGLATVEQSDGEVVATGQGPLLVQVAARLAALPDPPLDLRTERRSLEDVFLELTGRELRD